MRRTAAALTILVMLSALLATATDAWARAGGGGSKGSRGSRSYSAPARPGSQPGSPVAPSAPAPSATDPRMARPAGPSGLLGGGLLGGLGGLLLGGLLGSLLFGAAGGLGMLDLVVVGAVAYFVWSWFRRRQPAAAPAGAYASAATRAPAAWSDPVAAGRDGGGVAVAEPAAPSDLARGVGHIRQVDPAFEPQAFAERASEIFREVQAAWSRRDLSGVAGVLTPEMLAEFQKDSDGLRSAGKVNHLEQVSIQAAQVTEAWQERGQDFVTVRFAASLLDYTTDAEGRVLEGSAEAPVSCEEYWTFVRPVWAKTWRLSAIQQPV
jgi:predicted lipid-binding transport protein (Tim44 family)